MNFILFPSYKACKPVKDTCMYRDTYDKFSDCIIDKVRRKNNNKI